MNFFAVDISTGLTVASGAGRTDFFVYRKSTLISLLLS